MAREALARLCGEETTAESHSSRPPTSMGRLDLLPHKAEG